MSASRSERQGGARVRAEAARLAARVIRRGLTLESVLDEGRSLAERDRPLLKAMLYGVFRWHHRLEWQAAQLLDRPLKPRDAELSALLRIGLLQLQELRIPDHAAVSSTVEAARLLGSGHARGLVNAVLRRFLRERETLERRIAADVAAASSHPAWLVRCLAEDWPDEWQAILEANNATPPMWLRVNARRTGRAEYLERLGAAGIGAALGASPASVLLDEPVPMERLPGFREGLVSIQDGAAQLAAPYLGVEPGHRVLDACAAPGNKTAHILELAPGLAELWAIDRDPARLELVRANLDRLGLEAELLAGDAADPGAWWDGRPFHRILVDAPCSALGVIRRHPEIKVLRRESDVDAVLESQRALLDALWPLLAPGGQMLYSTCTILSAENRAQTEAFVARTPDARVSGPVAEAPLQRLPGDANMDGFYYACVKNG